MEFLAKAEFMRQRTEIELLKNQKVRDAYSRIIEFAQQTIEIGCANIKPILNTLDFDTQLGVLNLLQLYGFKINTESGKLSWITV